MGTAHQSHVARKTAAAAEPAGTRRRVAVDNTADDDDDTAGDMQRAPAATAVGGVTMAPGATDYKDEEKVEVFVKKPFKFVTDDHVMHDIDEGTIDVPRSWLEHAYFKAHGVEETKERKAAK